MNIREEIDKIREEGYNEANAEARLCQDILLKAISESSLKRNVTIKGGVVMRNLSKSARRATQDIDLDFICYSISDESIRAFIDKLNQMDGLKFTLNKPIKELNHQDYSGKRIFIDILHFMRYYNINKTKGGRTTNQLDLYLKSKERGTDHQKE